MDLSPMLYTHIVVETYSGREELPLVTMVDLWGISTPITHYLEEQLQTVLHASTQA